MVSYFQKRRKKFKTKYKELLSVDSLTYLSPVLGFVLFVPKFVNASGTSDIHTKGQFKLVYGTLICKSGKYRLQPLEDNSDSFRVNHSGWLLDESERVIAPPNQFCLEKFSNSNYQILPIVCTSPSKSGRPDESVSIKLTTIGMILSLPFLFTTFLVYALIKDLQNLQGKSLMCNVSTLLVGYACLIILQLNTEKTDWCVFEAYTMQFSFLASFFWLNVMCFDLWSTLSGLGRFKRNGAKRFRNYSIYAWGCSSFISIFTFSMDKLTSGAMHPGFGITSCWFSSSETLLLYFYGPIGIVLLSNMLMCVHTTLILIKHSRNAKEHIKESGNLRNLDHEKDRFMMYLKLFVVMGVNWIAEVVSWALDMVIDVADICNSLQGVSIFIIFVCKRRVLQLLIRKLCPQSKLFNSSNNVSTSSLSGTRSIIKNNGQIEMSADNI